MAAVGLGALTELLEVRAFDLARGQVELGGRASCRVEVLATEA